MVVGNTSVGGEKGCDVQHSTLWKVRGRELKLLWGDCERREDKTSFLT